MSGESVRVPSDRRTTCGFFLLAVANNAAYNVVLAAASDIARLTGHAKLMPALSGSLVALSVVVNLVNARFVLGFNHRTRNLFAAALLAVGVAGMTVAVQLECFALAIPAAAIIGLGTTLGAAATLGFSKAFDPQTVVGWSVGCSLAGLCGAGLYTGFKALGFGPLPALLMLLPLPLLHALLFASLLALQRRSEQGPLGDTLLAGQVESNQPLTLRRLPEMLRLLAGVSLPLAVLYFFRTGCTGFLAHALTQAGPSVHTALGFELLQVCYQLGACLGRLTLRLFRTRRLWLLAALEGTLFAGGLGTVWKSSSLPLWVLCVCAVGAGVTSGIGYVNAVFHVLNEPGIAFTKKEACLSANAAMADAAVVASSAVGVGLEAWLGRARGCWTVALP